ncbi:MAG TPA: heavy metal translocating P-type ATPase [Actinomycetaceae bacterium]|nr:heavy metal translocating P-type ATPase [Actinomycetaceae bacterium]
MTSKEQRGTTLTGDAALTENATATIPVVAEIDMAIEGMTCASCVRHVERRLNKMPGVTAVVNLATERAHLTMTEDHTDEELAGQVKAAGYGGTVTRRRSPDDDASPGTPDDEAITDTSDPSVRRQADLKRRFIVAAVLAVPIALLSMVPALQFPGWQWVVAALTAPVALWAAWPFHRAAFNAARHGSSTMDTLVSLGVIAATLWSLWALIFGGAGEIGMRMEMTLWPRAAGHAAHPELYFETAAVVTTFLLLGRWLESRSRRAAGDALRALAEMRPAEATKLVRAGSGVSEVRVPIAQIGVGDEFRVTPGEKIATDGVVTDGRSAVDASLLTGESVPVEVGPGDAVTGATLNTSGALIVRATRIGDDTALAQIGHLVEEAQIGKSPVQRIADKISSVFVPAVLVISVITFITWLATGGAMQAAFTAAIAVLIIACPCALGLATPTALLAGTGRAAQRGILIRGPEVLEATRRIDTVLLDKTGTLTTGVMELAGVIPLAGETEETVLARAASAEAPSEHPIAKAIARGAATSNIDVPVATDFGSETGLGVTAVVEGTRVTIGRFTHLRAAGLTADDAARAALEGAEHDGGTAVAIGWDGEVRGILVVRDAPKSTSREAVDALKEIGVRPVLLTGDAEAPARAIAAQVGIDDVRAGVLPGEKRDVVARFQADGKQVAMVGDGVNDAAALAQAGVHGLGIAMGTGTDVAKEASDITIVSGDPRAVPEAIVISRATLRVIRQNLFWAFAYNVAAIPLAAFGLLNPMIAGVAMAFSSVLVVSNSLRLRHAGGFRATA